MMILAKKMVLSLLVLLMAIPSSYARIDHSRYEGDFTLDEYRMFIEAFSVHYMIFYKEEYLLKMDSVGVKNYTKYLKKRRKTLQEYKKSFYYLEQNDPEVMEIGERLKAISDVIEDQLFKIASGYGYDQLDEDIQHIMNRFEVEVPWTTTLRRNWYQYAFVIGVIGGGAFGLYKLFNYLFGG